MRRLTLLLAFVPFLALAQSSTIDGLEDLVERRLVMIPMSDGVRLATDIYRPVLQADLTVDGLRFDLGPLPLELPRLTLARKGLAYVRYPRQADPLQLPLVVTRTPYNKQDPSAGYVFGLLGYAYVNQDVRGRYASEGVYLPMYSDSWIKRPYFSGRHLLDSSPTGEANDHEDGVQTLDWLLAQLRYDANGDGQVDSREPLLCNGRIGMFGASALGNTQLQAALARPVDPDAPGLKCLFPIVASAEFSQSAGHPNGAFREALIDGWLRGQIEPYPFVADGPANRRDALHTLADFGPQFGSSRAVAEAAIDFWSTVGNATDPASAFRSSMDASRAPLNATGEPDANGTVSRYRNLQVPVYHVTGWWDIFIDGQLETWQHTLAAARPELRGLQKLVIGPWAHQTIGNRSTGDMRIDPQGRDRRYPESGLAIINADLDGLNLGQIAQLLTSEPAQWFQANLGIPQIVLPPADEWQPLGRLDQGPITLRPEALLPADTVRLSFAQFFNFLNGSGGLELPVRIRGAEPLLNSTDVQRIPIPATGISLLGDTSRSRLEEREPVLFDARQPGGVPNVRFYVVGPVDDPQNRRVGNYWFGSDTFPLRETRPEALYLHADGRLDGLPPRTSGQVAFVADPENPVPTHGGANMLVDVPDRSRRSQGQMDFNDPAWRAVVLDRPAAYSDESGAYRDLIAFTTDPLADTLSVAGIPTCTLHVRSQSIDFPDLEELNGDFVVRVLDVYPDGRELYVFEGVVNARARRYAASLAEGREDVRLSFENISRGNLYEYRFEMLPIAYTWGRGHRLKVLVSGSNWPRYQSCPNIPLASGEFFRRPRGSGRTYRWQGRDYGSQRLLHRLELAPNNLSGLTLPVLGGRVPTIRAGAAMAHGSLKLRCWPQPATDRLHVELLGGGTCRWRLHDMQGRELMAGTFAEAENLNVETLPPGLYALQVADERGRLHAQRVLVGR